VALIICPKALKENWIRYVESYGAHYFVMSKEEFRKGWESLPGFDAVIVDEAHYFAGMKSQMTKALSGYMKKHAVTYRWLLTATPYLSTPWNIYTLSHHLGKTINWMDFKMRFFTDVRMGPRIVPVVKKDAALGLANVVAGIGDTVRLSECVDVPEQSFSTEYFEMTFQQKRAKKEVEEPLPIVRFTKYHQIESGTLKGNKYEDGRIYKTDKNERILSLVQENDKIAIFCRYNLQIDAIERFLEEKKIKTRVYVIRGDVKDRQGVVDTINNSSRCIVLINTACSEGYELPSVGVIVYASLDFSYKNYVQSQGRFLRINALKKNAYIHLVTRGGVDEDVLRAIEKKKDFDIAIYSKGMVE